MSMIYVQSCVGSDVIYTERRGQSQKPEEIYQLIEELVPEGIQSSKLLPQAFQTCTAALQCCAWSVCS